MSRRPVYRLATALAARFHSRGTSCRIYASCASRANFLSLSVRTNVALCAGSSASMYMLRSRRFFEFAIFAIPPRALLSPLGERWYFYCSACYSPSLSAILFSHGGRGGSISRVRDGKKRQDRKSQDRTRKDTRRQDTTRQDKKKQDKTRQNKFSHFV